MLSKESIVIAPINKCLYGSRNRLVYIFVEPLQICRAFGKEEDPINQRGEFV